MDIQITFREGPIEAEISAGEDEPYTEVLDALAEFAEDFDATRPASTGKSDSDNINDAVESGSTDEVKADSAAKKSNSLFDEVDATDSELHRVLKTGRIEDGDVEDFPEIIGNTDLLGTSIAERLLNGSVIILTILDEFHDISRVKTTELKDALGQSGLDTNNWGNVHQQENKDVYLDSRGTGASGTTAVRPPGKQDAYDYIQALVDDLREDNETMSESDNDPLDEFINN